MVTLRYVNPLTGASALPTMGCEMTRLVPRRRTRSLRKVGSSVYVVFRGRGISVIDGTRFEWAAGDSFVVPSWAAVDHEALEPADLFSIDDGPKRIFGFGVEQPRWDGTWSMVAFSVAEADRDRRHLLRTRLRWLTFAPLYPGLWISPHQHLEEAARVLEELGIDNVTLFKG